LYVETVSQGVEKNVFEKQETIYDMGTMQRGKRRQSSARRPPTGYTQEYTLLYSLPSTLLLILFLFVINSLFL
jgi:hypothetical protein